MRQVFELQGGDVAPDWARHIRPPEVPWCRLSIYSSGWENVPREHGGGTLISGYGGSVWPTAWPDIFEVIGPRGRDSIRLTMLGEQMFLRAMKV